MKILTFEEVKKGKKKDRFKTVYFPKALQRHLKDYLKVKARRGESLLSEDPLFISRNSAAGSACARCKGILTG